MCWRDWSSDVCSSDLPHGACHALPTDDVLFHLLSATQRRAFANHAMALARLAGARQVGHPGGRPRPRSEERRVGKESRSRASLCQTKRSMQTVEVSKV